MIYPTSKTVPSSLKRWKSCADGAGLPLTLQVGLKSNPEFNSNVVSISCICGGMCGGPAGKKQFIDMTCDNYIKNTENKRSCLSIKRAWSIPEGFGKHLKHASLFFYIFLYVD